MSEDPKQDPPPQEDPTHDVPVYPEQDPPPETQQPLRAASARPVGAYPRGSAAHLRMGWPQAGPGEAPLEEEEDVDEDDLDPQVPHSPPDSEKSKIVFDENKVAG